MRDALSNLEKVARFDAGYCYTVHLCEAEEAINAAGA